MRAKLKVWLKGALPFVRVLYQNRKVEIALVSGLVSLVVTAWRTASGH